MITGIFLSLALILGYAITVVLSMAATFAISSVSPSFVVKDHRIRLRYKLLQDLVWLFCAIAAGYITSWVAQRVDPWLAKSALAAVLVVLLWVNTWEMRQRGIPHQVAMTLLSVAGVMIGFALRMRGA